MDHSGSRARLKPSTYYPNEPFPLHRYALKPTALLVSMAQRWQTCGHGKAVSAPTHHPFPRAATLPPYARKRAGAGWPPASVP